MPDSPQQGHQIALSTVIIAHKKGQRRRLNFRAFYLPVFQYLQFPTHLWPPPSCFIAMDPVLASIVSNISLSCKSFLKISGGSLFRRIPKSLLFLFLLKFPEFLIHSFRVHGGLSPGQCRYDAEDQRDGKQHDGDTSQMIYSVPFETETCRQDDPIDQDIMGHDPDSHFPFSGDPVQWIDQAPQGAEKRNTGNLPENNRLHCSHRLQHRGKKSHGNYHTGGNHRKNLKQISYFPHNHFPHIHNFATHTSFALYASCLRCFLSLRTFHILSFSFNKGTYCLEIISFSPFFIVTSKRPLNAGLRLSTFARFMMTDFEYHGSNP